MGRPIARRAEKPVDSAELGHFGGRVALRAHHHLLGRQEDHSACGRCTAQLGKRHAVAGELLEQRQALRPRLALEAVQQALGGEVDLL